MNWGKLLEDRTSILMRQSKEFDFIKNDDESVYKRSVGVKMTFLVLYIDILLIRNDIPMIQSVRIKFFKHSSMNDLGKASYLLGIKIYIDRFKRILGLTH